MARRSARDTHPESEALGERLRALIVDARGAAGLTQQALATRAGISMSMLSKFEGGRSPEPGFFIIAGVAAAIRRELAADERRRFEVGLLDVIDAAAHEPS